LGTTLEKGNNRGPAKRRTGPNYGKRLSPTLVPLKKCVPIRGMGGVGKERVSLGNTERKWIKMSADK